MKNHLVNVSNCNTINAYPLIFFKGMTNNVGLTFGVENTIPQLTSSIEQDN